LHRPADRGSDPPGREDIDHVNQLLRIHDSKFGKSREVLIHETTMRALTGYLRRRDQLRPTADRRCVFISTRGTRLGKNGIYPTFPAVLRLAGLEPSSRSRRPRLHDLRPPRSQNPTR
jgi:site-specific recombinase XerD